MNQITKLVQESGNGGHIYLPKELIGKKVAVTLIEKSIWEVGEEALSILKPYLEHIQGIYLVGSYARGEQTPESDIDILVVIDSNIKLKKKVNDYEFIPASQEEIEKTLKNNAVLMLPFLKEAKVILNKSLLDKYKGERLTKENAKWYIETTLSSLELSKEYISLADTGVMPNIVYPLVMRLKGLIMIKSLINNKQYSNKETEQYLSQKGLPNDNIKQIIRMYREHRDNKRISENSLDYKDISKLHKSVYECYLEVEKLWAKLK